MSYNNMWQNNRDNKNNSGVWPGLIIALALILFNTIGIGIVAVFAIIAIAVLIYKLLRKISDSENDKNMYNDYKFKPDSKTSDDSDCENFHRTEEFINLDMMGKEKTAYAYANKAHRNDHSMSAKEMKAQLYQRKHNCTECGSPLFIEDTSCPLCGRRC